jgi:hypothetical protein
VSGGDARGRDTGGVGIGRTARRDKGLPATSNVKPPVLILSGIRWDFLWQRHQILATLFARNGYPTVYVETTGLRNPSLDPGTATKVLRRVLRSGGEGRKASGAVSPNLVVYSPLVAPPTWGLFRRLNRAVFVPRVARDLRRLLEPSR